MVAISLIGILGAVVELDFGGGRTSRRLRAEMAALGWCEHSESSFV